MLECQVDRGVGECWRVRVIECLRMLDSEVDRVFGECWRMRVLEFFESVRELGL